MTAALNKIAGAVEACYTHLFAATFYLKYLKTYLKRLTAICSPREIILNTNKEIVEFGQNLSSEISKGLTIGCLFFKILDGLVIEKDTVLAIPNGGFGNLKGGELRIVESMQYARSTIKMTTKIAVEELNQELCSGDDPCKPLVLYTNSLEAYLQCHPTRKFSEFDTSIKASLTSIYNGESFKLAYFFPRLKQLTKASSANNNFPSFIRQQYHQMSIDEVVIPCLEFVSILSSYSDTLSFDIMQPEIVKDIAFTKFSLLVEKMEILVNLRIFSLLPHLRAWKRLSLALPNSKMKLSYHWLYADATRIFLVRRILLSNMRNLQLSYGLELLLHPSKNADSVMSEQQK
ncbi:hypothetical protein BDF20DRAFT_835066 [Mycotypha africana]|uniref:uncharacterized protein n=1 Tax=Mycotypha africana TaxID=64632 RepID=UPI0023001F56|nr:uncharacterized protein BDF20DRAFT_835066 [Mycotypha africana]KAI8982446.1 hypothetical protein BDF20DRAFT_835066 [Mycotypha africana]